MVTSYTPILLLPALVDKSVTDSGKKSSWVRVKSMLLSPVLYVVPERSAAGGYGTSSRFALN